MTWLSWQPPKIKPSKDNAPDPTFYQGSDSMNYSQSMKMIIGPSDGGMIISSPLSIWYKDI